MKQESKFKNFLSKVYNSSKKIDLFGKPVDMLIAGEEMNKTFIGFIISIATLILSLVMTYPTFQDFIFIQNPIVVYTYDYDTAELQMNYDNFYFAVGFFSPIQGEKLTVSNTSNNYTALLNISDINIQCNTCNFQINDTYYETNYTLLRSKGRVLAEEANTTENSWNARRTHAIIAPENVPDYTGKNISSENFYLMYCETQKFEGIRIKSLAKSKSDDIANIMKMYSYCLPRIFNASITDGSTSKFDQSL